MTKDILSEYADPYLPRSVQLRRLQRVMERELTPWQREVLRAIYLEGRTQSQLARERGVNCSTICRRCTARRPDYGAICAIDEASLWGDV